MRVLMKMEDERVYVTDIDAAEAEWDDRTTGKSHLTLFGKFRVENNKIVDMFTIHFRTEIAFSLCKKLEKEGMADLSTNYMRNLISHEYYPMV